ncbi:hypothetical protein [Gracilibacillus alcaliphilus]|uniref:hypothetical protein n=1 Tax=Gracilibacillus alcaliphilus TaxID=1401441 RepID=UPI001959BBD4|nr:hypothetical protein [Gracilibacillus alcaliphilus]MBM7677104.1 hypothetical protein [Gracilibacillus alcaliphilus]
MSHEEDKWKKELQSLKIDKKLDSATKDNIRSSLQKYAKNKKKIKTKSFYLWASSAAVLLVCVVTFIYFNNQQQTSWQYEEDSAAMDQAMEGTEEMERTDQIPEAGSLPLSIVKGETEETSIIIEDTEQTTMVTHYSIEPYRFSYQIDTLFGTPEIDGQTVTYIAETGEASVSLQVEPYTTIEQVQYDYEQHTDQTDAIDILTEDDYPYDGLHQYQNQPPQGDYFLQVDQHVLVIHYQYEEKIGVEAAAKIHELVQSVQAF